MLGNYNTPYKTMSVSPVRAKGIASDDFSGWAASNMYRSSYRDMYKKSPVKNKNYAVPGYTGHIPGTTADTNYGKRFSVIAREQLTRDKYLPARTTQMFPQRPESLSPISNRSSKFGGGLLDEYHTVSRFHGRTTIPMTHPNFTAPDWSTNYSSTYKKQEDLRPQIFRKTDMEFWKKADISPRGSTKASGFVQNSTLFDGNGWLPIKELHGDMGYSEYRNRFNTDVSFHPEPLKSNTRKMVKKELVY